jgi:Na+-translocating ferredoxin:NAD+ oxidoreductase RnfG subunit
LIGRINDLKKNEMKNIILTVFLISLLSACSTTRITSSWSEPDKQISIDQLKKVLVVALFKNETSRHKSEDEMAGYLKGSAVVSYDYLNDSFNKQNEEGIRDKIKADGFDGAITMRLLDVEKDTSYSPGIISSYPFYYRSFSGYYYRNLPYYSNPSYYFTTKTYTVETNVYSIKEDKIIWTALTETTNPDGVDKMMGSIKQIGVKLHERQITN